MPEPFWHPSSGYRRNRNDTFSGEVSHSGPLHSGAQRIPSLPDIEFVLYRNSATETSASRELGNLLLKVRPLGITPWH
jgi:hypothetical protein